MVAKTRLYLVVDGMLHGTGVRDEYGEGYVELESLELTPLFIARIREWKENYEEQHFAGYNNKKKAEALDDEGILIAKALKKELPDSKLSYFSDATGAKYQIE